MASTVGQKLLDLCYMNTSRECSQWMTQTQRVLYAVMTIGAVWLENRLDDFIALTRHISYTASVCSPYMVSFLVHSSTKLTSDIEFHMHICMSTQFCRVDTSC